MYVCPYLYVSVYLCQIYILSSITALQRWYHFNKSITYQGHSAPVTVLLHFRNNWFDSTILSFTELSLELIPNGYITYRWAVLSWMTELTSVSVLTAVQFWYDVNICNIMWVANVIFKWSYQKKTILNVTKIILTERCCFFIFSFYFINIITFMWYITYHCHLKTFV